MLMAQVTSYDIFVHVVDEHLHDYFVQNLRRELGDHGGEVHTSFVPCSLSASHGGSHGQRSRNVGTFTASIPEKAVELTQRHRRHP